MRVKCSHTMYASLCLTYRKGTAVFRKRSCVEILRVTPDSLSRYLYGSTVPYTVYSTKLLLMVSDSEHNPNGLPGDSRQVLPRAFDLDSHM